MATTKITNPELFDLESLNTALKLPSGTTAERPTSPSTGEWRYNTTTNLVEFWDGGAWRQLQSEDIPPIPSEHFNTVLYSGTGSAQSITGVGFKPDLVWIKERSGTAWHSWFDTTRGVGNRISSNSVNAQNFDIQRLSSFDADGFSLGIDGDVNGSGKTFVAWCWKAGGGTTSSNTDGTITSDVQANTKTGFSLVKFTGTGANGTVGHGLGVAPEIIIFKNYPAISGWKMFTNQTPSPATQVMELQDASGFQTPTNPFNSTLPSSSVFSLGTYGDVNASGGTFIAYCFASVAGYSSIGSYTGNGSTNGPIVNTGFEPAFVIIKRTDVADNWSITDNKRNTTNPRNKALFPNLSSIELTSGYTVDYLSNGFQIKSTDNAMNANGGTYLYIAFGSDASTAPTLADSFANKIYSGNSSNQSITGLGFSPSFSWIKVRNNTYVHGLYDILRGPLQRLRSNGTEANENVPNSLTSFDSDGFTLGSDIGQNQTAMNYVSWNWKANSLPAINTDGTIQSIVSANQAAGFSIVKWTGDGNASSTVGHGLSGTPDFIMLKDLTDVGNWNGAQVGLASNEGIGINSSAGAFTGMGGNGGITYANLSATNFGFATGSSGVDSVNKNGNGYVAYCWKSVAGFSKMESYIGNGGSQSITTGFSPDWLMFKRTDQNGWNWEIADTARGVDVDLAANSSGAEQNQSPANRIQIDANGFTHLTGNYHNISGAKYIYMAYKANLTQYPIPSGYMGYLVVAGGAGGGYAQYGNGGGGGAGGLRTTYGTLSGGGASAESDLTLATGTYTITVGSGGSSSAAGTASTITGVASVSTVGGGAPGYRYGSRVEASSGGSGGGGFADGVSPDTIRPGGAGTAGEGFAGADSVNGSGIIYAGGGGGSAAAAVGVNGGDALSVSITGSNVFYAGGGGTAGKYNNSESFAGPAGTVTGGAGTTNGNGTNGQAAQANTGSGGGASHSSAGSSNNGGAGGSGIVVLRMNTSDYSGTTTGSPTVTTVGTETVLTYTGSGTYVHS
jgi:hypothetical protein